MVCLRNPKCTVLVEIGQTNQENLVSVCTLQFHAGPANQSKELEVVAKRDFVDDGDHMMLLTAYVLENYDAVDWDQHSPLPDIQVCLPSCKVCLT